MPYSVLLLILSFADHSHDLTQGGVDLLHVVCPLHLVVCNELIRRQYFFLLFLRIVALVEVIAKLFKLTAAIALGFVVTVLILKLQTVVPPLDVNLVFTKATDTTTVFSYNS